MLKLISVFLIMISFLNAIEITDLKRISKIPEASGIAYSEITNTLFVANDEGYLYEIDTEGNHLVKEYIGDYDIEGVSFYKNNLFLAIEKSDNILVLDPFTFKIKKEISIKRKFNGIKVLKKDKKHGLEAIMVHNDKIYVSNQSYNPYPEEDSSVIIQLDYDIMTEKLKIEKIINHGFFDIAGLTIHNDNFFMISDDSDFLIIYDYKNDQVVQKIKLPDFEQEGITLDKQGNIYFADDNGYILKGKIHE